MASAISHFQSSPHLSIVRVAGEQDIYTAPLLRAVLNSADADPMHEFVVELSEVTFMDCAGLAPLLDAHARLGNRLRLCDLPRAVSELLRLAGLDATFAIDGAALSALGGDEGAPSNDRARPRDHPSRTFAEGALVDEGALVHADIEHTGLGVLEVRTAGLGEVMGTRMVIEQAKGLLMASLGCDAKQASYALLQISWNQDSPVHDVAVALVAAAQNSRTPAKATKSAATAIG
jgi:anti-anti-sigma factor